MAKPKTNKRAKTKGRESWQLLGISLRIIAAVVLAALLVGGLGWIGQRSGEKVSKNSRYTRKFLDIDCPAPPGMDRVSFLMEVRYEEQQRKGLDTPDTFQIVDPDLPDRLREAFRNHAWVKSVTEVVITPKSEVKVGLDFRIPILAITEDKEPELRALDETGVLLPFGAATQGLARLLTPAKGRGNSGQPHPDLNARRAAELIAAHAGKEIEKRSGDWYIKQDNGRILRVSGQ